MQHGITHRRSQPLIDFAYTFASLAHEKQCRKYTGEPYIVHPVEVARIVASITDDCEMIAAAFLHDTVEDTDVSLDEIRQVGFGSTIARLVDELTDKSRPEDGNRAARKAIDRRNLANASARAQTVKVADLISNTRSIVGHDPKFAKVYLAEKAALLDVLTKADAGLLEQARLQVQESLMILEEENECQP